ncbi:MAG: hypothetical protein QOD99_2779 [Chthoniobacter sp.]|nr:hypothetical protein [Chthoniobacter sp.]
MRTEQKPRPPKVVAVFNLLVIWEFKKVSGVEAQA